MKGGQHDHAADTRRDRDPTADPAAPPDRRRPGPGPLAHAGLAQRDPAQALSGEAARRHPDADRVPGAVPLRFRGRGGRQHPCLPGTAAARSGRADGRVRDHGTRHRALRGHSQGRVRPVPQPADRPVLAPGRRGTWRHGPVRGGDGGADRVRLAARVPLPHRGARGAGRVRPGLRVLPGGVLDLGTGRAGRALPGDRAGIAFIFIMPLVFGSSILLPSTQTMPGWLQAWVKVNPVTSLADAVRGLTVGGPVATHAMYALAWAAGIVVVAFPLAMRMYRRRV